MNMPNSKIINCKKSIDYFEGLLDSEDAKEFKLHLSNCESCQTTLDHYSHVHKELLQLGTRAEFQPENSFVHHIRCYHSIANTVKRLKGGNRNTVREALKDFTQYYNECRSSLVLYIQRLLDENNSREQAKAVLNEALANIETCQVAAFLDKTDDVSESEAIALLQKDDTRISKLVSASDLELFIAEANPNSISPTKRFEAFWFIAKPNVHFIIVSCHRDEEALAEAVCHEIDHQRTTNYDPKMSHRVEEAMAVNASVNHQSNSQSKTYESFASSQSGIESQEKKLIANKVAHDIPLKHGHAIVIDAGSTCLELWRSIVELIEAKRFMHSIVYTNSLPILADWSGSSDNFQLRITTLEVICTRIDAEHLAFYNSESNDKEAEEKLMSKNFRAMNVYIGTSGIEFDIDGHIYFGYHAGPQERVIKELLFKCNAERRIILTTPSKIGFVGGRVFDILEVDGFCPAPIDLVTTTPKKGSPEEEKFDEAKAILTSKQMKKAIKDKRISFRWIIIDRETGIEVECIE